jgi:hypothetical protein
LIEVGLDAKNFRIARFRLGQIGSVIDSRAEGRENLEALCTI